MAKRYSGDLQISLVYNDRNFYRASVSHNGRVLWKGNVSPAPAGFGPGIAYDSPRAFDAIASSALAFADDEVSGIGDHADYDANLTGYLVHRTPPAKRTSHATRKSPAQLNREINTALARRGSRQHSSISAEARIRAAIDRFPPTFGLRGFPGDVFRISPTASYISGGDLMLYTQRKEGGHWLDFSKGTEPELRAEVVTLPPAGVRTARKGTTGSAPRNHATIGRSYRVSALVGSSLPVNLGTVSKKAAAMKVANDFMKKTPPKTEYDSVQILPLVRGQRDWNTESMRWLGVTTNVRRPTWVRGQGVK